MDFKSRLRVALPDVDEDIVAELTDHAKATYESARASGDNADEAERRVEMQIQAWVDNAASLRRRPKAVPAVIPPVPVTNHIAAVRQDVRYLGLLASMWLTRALQGLLFGVTSHDLVTFVGVTALLVVVTAIATITPARRAATLDPIKALRS